jgi:NSS family neurotransmitter:Na+ symporter
MVLTIFIVANNIKQGIEWVSKRFVPLLIVMMLFLIIAIPFVDSSKVNYGNFNFNFSALFSIDNSGRIGVIEAVGQAFFSLSLGACAMVTNAIKLRKKVAL